MFPRSNETYSLFSGFITWNVGRSSEEPHHTVVVHSQPQAKIYNDDGCLYTLQFLLLRFQPWKKDKTPKADEMRIFFFFFF